MFDEPPAGATPSAGVVVVGVVVVGVIDVVEFAKLKSGTCE